MLAILLESNIEVTCWDSHTMCPPVTKAERSLEFLLVSLKAPQASYIYYTHKVCLAPIFSSTVSKYVV